MSAARDARTRCPVPTWRPHLAQRKRRRNEVVFIKSSHTRHPSFHLRNQIKDKLHPSKRPTCAPNWNRPRAPRQRGQTEPRGPRLSICPTAEASQGAGALRVTQAACGARRQVGPGDHAGPGGPGCPTAAVAVLWWLSKRGANGGQERRENKWGQAHWTRRSCRTLGTPAPGGAANGPGRSKGAVASRPRPRQQGAASRPPQHEVRGSRGTEPGAQGAGHTGRGWSLQPRRLHQHPRETQHWFHSPLPGRRGGDTHQLARRAHAANPAASHQHTGPRRTSRTRSRVRRRTTKQRQRPVRTAAPGSSGQTLAPGSSGQTAAPGSSGDRVLRH